jgi:hypothetical protein
MAAVVVLAFVLGVYVRPHSVKAEGPLQVYVTKTPLKSYGSMGSGNTIAGNQILGFSCVHGDIDADCYVLSTK